MKTGLVARVRSSRFVVEDLSRRLESKEHQSAKQDGRPGDDGCAEFLRVEEVNVGTLSGCACTLRLVPIAGEYCRVSRGW